MPRPVYKNSPWRRLISDGECLLWPNETTQCKYLGRDTRAPRVAWERAHGLIPDGLNVCHTCDRPRCVALAHLWLGTQLENIRDMDQKGRRDPVWGYAHRRKLTHDDLVTIGALRSCGWSTYRIWRELYSHLNYSTIKRAANGNTWNTILAGSSHS